MDAGSETRLSDIERSYEAGFQAATTRQPMEKAPKDGTQILAYGTYQWEDYEDMEKTGYAVIFWSSKEKKWKLANANPYSDFMQPSWWMHLPPEQKIIDTTQKN